MNPETEKTRPPRRRRPPPLPRISRGAALIRVGVIGFVTAVVILGGLTLQMAAGNDPALGPKIERRAASSATSSASITQVPNAAPSPSAPPVGADQPSAPAPAPVQTGTS